MATVQGELEDTVGNINVFRDSDRIAFMYLCAFFMEVHRLNCDRYCTVAHILLILFLLV